MVTVLPQPKPPGIAQVPPFAIGKRLSIVRWPVKSGVVGGSFCLNGRGVFIGHVVLRVMFVSFMVAMVSFMWWVPLSLTKVTTPDIGASIWWAIRLDSCTVAIFVWAVTFSPCFICMVVGQVLWLWLCGVGRGRPMPSRVLPIRPGDKGMERGLPVHMMLSPWLRPVVSSYTCMVIRSWDMLITSPISLFWPTCTISRMVALPLAFITEPFME